MKEITEERIREIVREENERNHKAVTMKTDVIIDSGSSADGIARKIIERLEGEFVSATDGVLRPASGTQKQAEEVDVFKVGITAYDINRGVDSSKMKIELFFDDSGYEVESHAAFITALRKMIDENGWGFPSI